MTLEVKELKNASGSSYIEKEIERWPEGAVKKMLATLQRLERLGFAPLLHVQEIKKLAGRKNLYEIREKHHGICYRIFGTLVGNIFWLLRAFQKKEQRTPLHEIETAEKRAKSISQ